MLPRDHGIIVSAVGVRFVMFVRNQRHWTHRGKQIWFTEVNKSGIFAS